MVSKLVHHVQRTGVLATIIFRTNIVQSPPSKGQDKKKIKIKNSLANKLLR